MFLLTLLLYGVVSILVCLAAFVFYFRWLNRYHMKLFQKEGIPFLTPDFNVIEGVSTLFDLMRGKMSMVDLEMDVYQKAMKQGKGKPLVGVSDLTGPMYYVTDLELMKSIYVKDFDHFMNRRTFTTAEADMFTKMLISMEGDKWKAMRSKISPTFTTSKIRRVFDIFNACSLRMREYLEKYVGSEGKDLDVTQVYAKFATDVIANCVFGIDSQCFKRDLDDQSEFEKMGSSFQIKLSFSMFTKFIFVSYFPNVARRLNIQPMDATPQQYFTKIIKDVMKRRRETGERREDFLQLLMDIQAGLMKEDENSKETLEVMTGSGLGSEAGVNVFKSEASKLTLDDDTVIANCELFLLAGFDTTKSVLLFSTYALALNQDVQERLYKEIRKVSEENGGKLTYDAINKMTYLDCFLNEALRYYPATARTERLCTKDYKVPGTDWVIPKGRIVVLPIYGLHHDEAHYKNVKSFDPDRFLNERKSERHPFSYSPFGHGPRNCIGMRFALFEVKAMIFHMIHHFKLEPCAKTDIPPKFSNNPNLRPKNGMWLKIVPRSK